MKELSVTSDSQDFLGVDFSGWPAKRCCPLPAGWRLVYTAQQRGAIAVYLCEASSDDGLLACEWIEAPALGAEFPAWRVHNVSA